MRVNLRIAHKQMSALPLLILASLSLLCSSAFAQSPSCFEIQLTDKSFKLAIVAGPSSSYVAAADAYKSAHYLYSVVIYRDDYTVVGGDRDDYDMLAKKVLHADPDIVIVCSDTPDRWRKELTTPY